MLKFITQELENEVKECLKYLDENQKGRGGLNLDFYDLISEDFDPNENEDVIDENYSISISPDESEEILSMDLRSFLNLMMETRNATLVNRVKCISNERCLIRVTPKLYKDIEIIDVLINKKDKIFETESSINNIKFNCSLVSGVTLFGIMVHFSDDFDKYYPSVVTDDLFIEIIPVMTLGCEDIDRIINAYMFELYATHDIKIYLNPRTDGDFEGIEEATLQKEYIFRPLLFSLGMDELISLFNEAENGFDNSDFAIIQYTKVIEFVSQTVIRQEITGKAQNRLMSSRALSPDANYIKELENMFHEFKQKFDTDRSAIRITIKTCCDIFEIIGEAPKYLDKISKLQDNMLKEKSDKEKVLESIYDLLADSISDTRNFIAHAKANYILKGQECPKDQKDEFIKMLRILAIQVIRWFSSTNEGIRIVAE